MKCPHCGAELQEKARFCLYCMVSLEEKTEMLSPPSPKGRWKIWLVLALCLLLLAAAVMVLLRAGKEEASDPRDSTVDDIGKFTAEQTQEAGESTQTRISVLPDETDALTEQPRETQSAPAEPQSECEHNYREATCIAPMTCIYCGMTRGSVSEAAHAWEDVTLTVYHEEMGHYEEVCIRYDPVTKYGCGYCSEIAGSYDELVAHFQSAHSGIDNYEWHLAHLDDMCDVIEELVPVYETQWIVDQPAYNETVVTGRRCSLCGKED